MSRLKTEQRAPVLAALVEGNSIRATVRMTDVAKKTVLRLRVEIGGACADYQDRVLHDLPCTRLQADETWAFVGMKQKTVPED